MTLRGVRRTLMAALLALAVSACGSSSEVSPPSGVDELTIPTPSPDPADFVERVDNPWFPLEPGTVWTYADVSDGTLTPTMTVTVTVTDETLDVAGVGVTVVQTVEDGETVTDFYAQDTSGNVWWFGRPGEWTAGIDGAEAGLVMPASPRVGDGYRGYRRGFAEGEVDSTSEVLAIGDEVDVSAGAFDDVVVIENRTPPLSDGVESSFAQGTGLVSRIAEDGSGQRLELVEVRRP